MELVFWVAVVVASLNMAVGGKMQKIVDTCVGKCDIIRKSDVKTKCVTKCKTTPQVGFQKIIAGASALATATDICDEDEACGVFKAGGSSWLAGPAASSLSDWMRMLPDSTPVNRVYIPGTHDSLAIPKYHTNVETNKRFDLGTGWLSQCQSWTFQEQLDSGLRFFDIRIKWDPCRDCASLDLPIYHGVAEQNTTWEPTVVTLKKFLDDNPSEFVIANLQKEGEHLDASTCCPSKTGSWWGDVQATMDAHGLAIMGTMYDSSFTVQQARGQLWLSPRPDDREVWQQNAWGECDYDEKFRKISELAANSTEQPDTLVLNFLSAVCINVYTRRTPLKYAMEMNGRFWNSFHVPSNTHNTWGPGVFAMDFPSQALVQNLVSANFREVPEPTERYVTATERWAESDNIDEWLVGNTPEERLALMEQGSTLLTSFMDKFDEMQDKWENASSSEKVFMTLFIVSISLLLLPVLLFSCSLIRRLIRRLCCGSCSLIRRLCCGEDVKSKLEDCESGTQANPEMSKTYETKVESVDSEDADLPGQVG